MDKKFANLNQWCLFPSNTLITWSNWMKFHVLFAAHISAIKLHRQYIYILLFLTFILRLKLISLHNRKKKSKIILENFDLICGVITSITAAPLKFRDYWIKQTYESNYDKWIQNYYNIPVEYENINKWLRRKQPFFSINTFAIYSINYRIRKVELELTRNFLRLDYGRNCKNPPTKLKNVPHLFSIKL